DDVPIEKSYDIDDVYYRTSVGANVTFNVDYDITLSEAINRAPEKLLNELDGTLTLGEYQFESSDEGLATVESDNDFTKEELEDWAFLVIEDEVPMYAVFEHEDTVYVIEAPSEVDEYIE
ncbi:MAG: hypothetical protein ACOCU0_02640, partial [Bacillota bacterium]